MEEKGQVVLKLIEDGYSFSKRTKLYSSYLLCSEPDSPCALCLRPPRAPISSLLQEFSRNCPSECMPFRMYALGSDLLGDFGARDPFPAELESKFGEKVLGNFDTEHKILIPNISALSLAQRECTPVSSLQPPISEDDAQKLLKKVVGWRLLNDEGELKLQCLWKLKDFRSGVELINRICKVTEAAGHFPNLHLEKSNQVRAELWTASIGKNCTNTLLLGALAMFLSFS